MGNAFGDTQSNIEKQLGDLSYLGNEFPVGEHYVGFENYKNNICYANSILQALYYCEIFRNEILNYKCIEIRDSQGNLKENIISIIQEIFLLIKNNKKKVNILSTKKLMNYVQKKNCKKNYLGMFGEDYHHDSHEFLIWLLNEINDRLQEDVKDKNAKTWLTKIFEGEIESQTKCLSCKVLSSIKEPYLALSLDLEDNTSLNYCIKQMSKHEYLKDQNKFQCDKCNQKVEAQKQVILKTLPQTLIIQFKRFKYDEKQNRMIKLNWKIAFSFDIRIDSLQEKDNQLYKLYSVIVHIGTGFQYGHYISFIKNNDRWIQFDDDQINLVDESQIYNLFGNSQNMMSAYMLFYQLAEK